MDQTLQKLWYNPNYESHQEIYEDNEGIDMITIEELEDVLNKMKNRKAGIDGIN